MATKAQMKGSGFSFNLMGFDEVMDNLNQLPTISMKKTVLKNALKNSLIPTQDEARKTAPYDPRPTKGFEKSKHLRDTITISGSLKPSQKRGRISDRSRVKMYVGSTAPHAHLIEFGTVEREREKTSVTPIGGDKFVMAKSAGRGPAIPFLRNAWDWTKSKALKIFAAEMRKELNKSARRLAKRAEAGKLTAAQIRGLR